MEKDRESKAREWEEAFEAEDRKLSKLQRKLARAQDRSKYKKSDRAKFLERTDVHENIKIPRDQLLRGRVLSILSQQMVVDCQGKRWNCVLRGLLKKEKTRVKNLAAVGDFVLFEPIAENEGFIAHIEPRHTVLSRADSLSRRKQQIIAANIDQVLITVSVVKPTLKPSLVDRYIIATRKGGMEPIVVINKIDLLEDPSAMEEKQLYHEFIEAYPQKGLKVLSISAASGWGLGELRHVMQDKASVFSGQSGVGKSSLINAVTGLDLPVGETVVKTGKGVHTTTRAHLLPLDFGGWCVDTPGIRSFGVWNLCKEEVQSYFEEIDAFRKNCRFSSCSHTQEEGCAVRQAVAAGKISEIRYESYQNLLQTVEEEHRRR